MKAPDSTNPADPAPSDVENRLRTDEGQFRAEPDGNVRCLTCRETSPASALAAAAPTRLEGASDPDDMLMILRITCPVCGTTGSLTLGYGPIASLEDTDVLRDIQLA